MNSSIFFKLLIIIICFLIFWSLRDFFLLIICSLVLANIICNLCNQVKTKFKLPRALSLLIVIIFLSLFLLVSTVLILPPFIKEFNEILGNIPNALARINLILNANLDRINSILYGDEVENIFDIIQNFNEIIPLPDGATIVKAIQESFINIIVMGNYGKR